MLTPITGQTAIVTGGSKGIGRGIARVFARAGAKVLIVGRDLSAAEAAAAELTAEGGTALAHSADVSDWDAVQGMVAAATEALGGVDILCANAGAFPQSKLIDMEVEEWDAVMATNLRSSFLCTKACIPAFKAKGGGRIVLTSSITGPFTGFPGWTHYGASKSGQLGFLKTAAMELSRYNVTINAVLPGNIATEGLADLGQDYLDTMAASIPLKRLGDPEDIGNAALFFASKEAGYITGQTIVVDGGQILPESLEAIEEI